MPSNADVTVRLAKLRADLQAEQNTAFARGEALDDVLVVLEGIRARWPEAAPTIDSWHALHADCLRPAPGALA